MFMMLHPLVLGLFKLVLLGSIGVKVAFKSYQGSNLAEQSLFGAILRFSKEPPPDCQTWISSDQEGCFEHLAAAQVDVLWLTPCLISLKTSWSRAVSF